MWHCQWVKHPEDWGSGLCRDHKRLNFSVPLVARLENVWIWEFGKQRVFVFWYFELHRSQKNRKQRHIFWWKRLVTCKRNVSANSVTFHWLKQMQWCCCSSFEIMDDNISCCASWHGQSLIVGSPSPTQRQSWMLQYTHSLKLMAAWLIITLHQQTYVQLQVS